MNPGHDKRAYFDRLYAGADDPYGLRDRWYEARKRAVLLAALPRSRYARAYEPACGAGELTLELAPRCDSLLASDFTDKAVEVTRQRVAGLSHVRVERHGLPQDWPSAPGAFDLIVLSEVGYFLEPAAWRGVAEACRATLAPGGTLVACHWWPDFDERLQPTEAVHAALHGLGLHRLLRHDEADFLLELWSSDAASVAQAEGIR